MCYPDLCKTLYEIFLNLKRTEREKTKIIISLHVVYLLFFPILM